MRRTALLTWLAFAAIASAQQTGGFGGGTGGSGSSRGGSGSSSGGISGGSGSGSNSNNAQAGVNARSLLGSFPSSTSRGTSAIDSSNLLSTYAYNPYAQGLITGSGMATSVTGFGQAVYSSATTGGASGSQGRATGISGGSGSTSSLGGQRSTGMTGSNQTMGGSFGNTNVGGRTGTQTSGGFGGGNQANTAGRNTGSMGFSPGNIPSAGGTPTGTGNRMPAPAFSPSAPTGLKPGILYPTNIGFPVAVVPAADFQTQLSGVLTRSSGFVAPGNMRVEFNNGQVILRGNVANEAEARRAENLLRLEPGVRDIRNELQFQK